MSYKELDRSYIAKQFNGPVVSSFIKAVYNFFHKDIDAHADYFKNLSIDTANTDHLVFIGKLMGLQLFGVLTDQSGGRYLTYTLENYDALEYGYNNGWSEMYERGSASVTGVFGTGVEKAYPVPLDNDRYIAILNALGEITSGTIDSIYAIDTVTYAFLGSVDYYIEYSETNADVIVITVGASVNARTVDILQNIFNRVLRGGTTIKIQRSQND